MIGPKDEQISAMQRQVILGRPIDRVYLGEMLMAWLAERQTARNGVIINEREALTCPFCGMDVEIVMQGGLYKDRFWYIYHPEHPRGECILEDKKFSSLHGWNTRAALQSVAQPITSVSDALNFLEEWAIKGNTLHGDDIQRFHATVKRIAPIAQSVEMPRGWKLVPIELSMAMHEAVRHLGLLYDYEKRIWSAMLSAAPAYKRREGG